MPPTFVIRPIHLDNDSMPDIAAEARAEGFRFIDRLLADWQSGTNRFAATGEILLAVFADDALAAVGGLNRDPYTTAAGVGRIRHVYVSKPFRRLGAGRLLLDALLANAHHHFTTVRLRTTDDDAAQFYEAYGFHKCLACDATHEMTTGHRAVHRGP